MSTVLDHTQDLNGSEQFRLTRQYPPPGFVKSAGHDRLYGDSGRMASHLYADQAGRNFPLHTAPAVWMSTLFFLDKQAQLNPTRALAIGQRLDQAAGHFGIKNHTDRLKQAFAAGAPAAETAAPDGDFALVWKAGDTVERHYPLRNAREVKVAAEWFEKYRDEFEFNDRSAIAGRIHEKAARFGVALDQAGMLEKTAGHGSCPLADAVGMLRSRANMTARSHPRESREMAKFAEILAVEGLSARDTAKRHKIAATVDLFDRVTKLNRLYDEGGLERPEETLFLVGEKAAGEFLADHVQMTSGTVYEKRALNELPLEHIRTWMGGDFADEVTAGLYADADKIAAVAATLPRGDAEMFDQMAAAAGVRPYARDKAACATGMGRDEVFALAAQYGERTP